MKILVFYRRTQDGKCPSRPDYEREYVRGEDVEIPSGSWTDAASAIGDRPVGQPRDGRLSRPIEIGDVLVNEHLDSRILTPLGVWARVAAPTLSAVDLPALGGR